MRVILGNWWRHKERFILFLIGILVISSGLSYLVGSSQNSKGTVVDTLRKNWHAQYHILVRPPHSRSISENESLLSPNYLSGLKGGISLKQYKTILDMDDISVAAPLAMVGYTTFEPHYRPFNLSTEPNKVYRIINTKERKLGYQTIIDKDIRYITTDPNLSSDKIVKSNGLFIGLLPQQTVDSFNVTSFGFQLLAGIDPTQEAKLVGLDKAVLNLGTSRYFNEEDKASTIYKTKGSFPQTHTTLPLLISNRIYTDTDYTYQLVELDLQETNYRKFQKELNGNGLKYLNSLKGKVIDTQSVGSNAFYQASLNILTKDITNTKITDQFSCDKGSCLGGVINLYPSSLHYKQVKSPFPDRWRFSFEVLPNKSKIPKSLTFVGLDSHGFREFNDGSLNDENKQVYHYLKPDFIGVYDPSKLSISKSALTRLPMETYRPPTAKLVLNDTQQPVNPPIEVNPTGEPNGFLLEPPTLLTTIDAAEQILGDKPISSIRVKVKDVDELTSESEKKLKEVAKKIEEKTGLITDITLGSSPQPTLIHIPKSGDINELGWVEMPWIRLGSTFTLFNETKIGFSGIMLIVLLVAMTYILSTNLISFLVRRKQWAILLSAGWRPSSILKLILCESLLFGAISAIVSCVMEVVFFWGSHHVTFEKIILVAVLGLVIYLIGGIGPALLVFRLSPYEAIKTGDTVGKARRILNIPGLIGIAMHHMMGKLKRYIFSVIAMIFPTVLLAFFLFITIRLKGVFYTTWLGQYAALQVGIEQYIAMIIALIVAILTTSEIMWLNVSERKSEIALYKAIGWRDVSIRTLILVEGLFIGVIAGIISVISAYGLIAMIYHQLPKESVWIILATGLIPIVVGIIGSLLPAEIAVKIRPSRGMR